MARYDKYDPKSGGFRAVAAADNEDVDLYDLVQGVGLDATGKAVIGDASVSGFKGVTIIDRTKRKAGDVQDVMTAGEIVGLEGLDPGTSYYLGVDGLLTDTAPLAGDAGVYVGHTVEAWRLVVRFAPVSTPV